MALVLTIGGNNHTSELVHESLVVNQTNDGLNSTCTFDLVDTAVVREDVWTVGVTKVEDGDVITGHITFSEPKVEVSVVDGATVYFAGILSRVNILSMGVIDVRGTLEAETQILRCACHDFNAMLEESIVDSLEEYVNQTDEAIIDDIFAKYVTGIDFATHVDGGAFTFKSISFENLTVRQVLDLIVARTDYVWYVDYSKKLHYSALEANSPAWHLSDAPDQVNSFSYLDPVRRETDATNLVNMIFVAGAEGGTWYTDEASRVKYGDHKAIIKDARLSVDESMQARADTLLDKFANPIVTYVVKTYEDDLRAGVNLRVVCAYYDLDETLLINRLMIKFPVDGAPIYELTLGGLESSRGASAQRLTLDQIYDPPPVPPGSLPIASRGWGHDLTFTATDHETVTWAAGTLTTAGGQTFAINAGDTDDPGAMAAKTIVYLDLVEDPTTPHDLQLTTDETAALGINKIMVAVCWPGIAAAGAQPEVKAGFQVFGSTTEVATFLNATNIIANAITANEIYVNQLSAIVADMGTLTAGAINIVGIGGRIILNDAGLHLYDATPNLRATFSSATGTFKFTSAEAGNPRIEIGSTQIVGKDGANVEQFKLLAATGKASCGAGAVVLDKDGIAITGGKFSMKTAAAGNPRIEIDNTRVAGLDGANVLQFELRAADGVAQAGAGNVILDEDGLTLVATDVATARVKWITGGVTLAYLGGYTDGDYNYWKAETPAPTSSGVSGAILLNALANAAHTDTRLSLVSESDGLGGYMRVTLHGQVRFTIEAGNVRVHHDLRVEGGIAVGGDFNPGAGQVCFQDGLNYLYKDVNDDLYWKKDGVAAVKLN